MVRKALFVCGIVSSLLYVAATVLGAVQWEGYSSTSQGISELSAIGAPTRSFMISLFIPYSLLLTAFGLGVWGAARGKRAQRFLGALLVVSGIIDLAAPFFPMHLRGAEATFTDTMHITLTALDVLLFLLTIGFGAAAFGKRFRFYSIATILILIVCGAVAGLDGPRLAANQPTPWLGVTERINVYVAMLWRAVLAVSLLRVDGASLQEAWGSRRKSSE